MAQVGVGGTREVCEECGAVIGDRKRPQWHELLATVLPGWHELLARGQPGPDQ